MAKKPVFDFKTWYENLPADNPEEELKGIAIPDPFGFDVGSESDLSERRIFVTDFLPGDVEDFLKNLLEKYKPTQNNKKSLSVIFTRYFENWQNEHRKSCFYEPFLWALKCRDNYIGSLRNNADPQPWLVEFLGDLLYKQWKDTPDFMKVLENVITNWEWYQPVHIMLYVYRKLANVNEESLDKHIRENLLYRSLFSTSAFFCLCEKKKSRENIKALMFFVSKEEQDSTGFTKIQITKKMREGVEKYIKNLSDSEFDVAQTYYTDEMRSCSRKARKFYDDIFFPNPSIESEISDLANEWRANENKEYSALYKSRLAALLDKDNKQVIRVTANSRCESMIDSLLTIIDERQFDFYTQLILREMAGYAGCEKYTAYIKNKYLSYSDNLTDIRGFVYGCAYCLIGNCDDILGKLFDVIYFSQDGMPNGKLIFFSLRLSYSVQYNTECEKLVGRCINNQTDALSVLLVSAKLFGYNTRGNYPIIFDKICESLLNDSDISYRCATAVIELLENVATDKNRARYETMLYKLKNLDDRRVSERASDLIMHLFGTI